MRNARRRRAALERLPPPPGHHAGGPRQCREHRLPAAPLDLRPEGRAARRAALRRDSPASSCTRRRSRTGTACCSPGRATRARTLRASPPRADWDFSGYVLDSVRVDEYDINWKTFIETYLEVYHVDPSIPAWATSPIATTSRVDYGEDYSVQIVAAKSGPGAAGHAGLPASGTRPASSTSTAATPKHGALWATYYPGPDVRVVSERARSSRT